jgi:hypothetical protein
MKNIEEETHKEQHAIADKYGMAAGHSHGHGHGHGGEVVGKKAKALSKFEKAIA